MTPATLELIAHADELFRTDRFTEAIPALQKLTELSPLNGKVWGMLAESYYETAQWEAMLEPAARALELGSNAPRYRIYYMQAIAYAQQGKRTAALESLRTAVAHNMVRRRDALEHPAFATYHDDPEFCAIMGVALPGSADHTAGWRADLKYLVAEIQRLHPQGKQIVESDEFTTLFKAIYNSVPALSDAQLVGRIQSLWVLSGDGHSTMFPINSDKIQFLTLPLALYDFPEGLYVVDSEPSEFTGCRLDAIGGVRAADLMQRAATITPHDNPQTVRWAGPHLLMLPLFLYYLGVTNDPTQATLHLTMPDGNQRELTLQGRTFDPAHHFLKLYMKLPPPPAVEAPLYQRAIERNIWMGPLPALNALYIQYNQVRNHPEQKISDFAAQLKQTLQSTPTPVLILDVRHNNGGNNMLNWPLVRTLIWFEETMPTAQIFVLIGRNTFSACQNFVNTLERRCKPVFIGEPTGSRPNFYGETTQVILPYSGLQGSISCYLWQDAIAWDNRQWLAPHIHVELSAADYFSGHDPVITALHTLLSA